MEVTEFKELAEPWDSTLGGPMFGVDLAVVKKKSGAAAFAGGNMKKS